MDNEEFIEIFDNLLTEELEFKCNFKYYWSGFYSQGDGLCFDFELDHNESKKLIKAIINKKDIHSDHIKQFRDLYMRFENSIFEKIDDLHIFTVKNIFANNYSHEKTRNIRFDYNTVYDVINGVENELKLTTQDLEDIKNITILIIDWYRDTCLKFYNMLQEHEEESDMLDKEEKSEILYNSLDENEKKIFILKNKDLLLSKGVTHYVKTNIFTFNDERNSDDFRFTDQDFSVLSYKYDLVHYYDDVWWLIGENLTLSQILEFPEYECGIDISSEYVSEISELS